MPSRELPRFVIRLRLVRGRGGDARQGRVRSSLFSYVDLEQRIRSDHPLRLLRSIVNATLAEVSAEFDALYPATSRDSIPPEPPLRGLLLQAIYSVRSERQRVKRIDFDLLFHPSMPPDIGSSGDGSAVCSG